MPRYFTGRSVKSNRVRASSARNFRELVQTHLETAMKLAVTQAAYAAMTTRAERLDAKDSPYLTACVFRESPSSRSIENAENCCNLIFLDLDEDEDGKCPARPFVRNPELISRALSPFNFAAYTTASSTEKKPRMRIVVDAEKIPLKLYPAAVRDIARRLGLTNVTRESLVPNQPMICPSRFADQDPDSFHPLLATRLKGEAFKPTSIEDEDEAPAAAKRKAAQEEPEDDSDGLAYMRTRLEGVGIEDIAPALQALNPDMPYPEWFDMAAALRHQFSADEDEAESAYQLFDAWSSKGSKYVSEDDTRAKWNSVKPTPKGRVPVTIRTLIKRAADAGWSASAIKESCFSVVMDWISHEAKTLYDLTHKALEKIAGIPLLTSSEEDMLLSAIRQALKRERQETVALIALRKDLKKLRDVKDRTKDGAAEAKEPEWAKGWCYITAEEKFFRPSSHQCLSPDALNKAFGRYLLPTPEQLESLNKDATQGELNKPLYLPVDYLLNHQQCLVVDDRDYNPSAPKEVYTENAHGVRLVNTYRRSYPRPNFKRSEEAGKIWRRHLRHLIAEQEYRDILCDYFAYMVQFPGRKIRWAPLIQGAEGCGKTMMAKALGAVLGDDNVSFVNNDAIRSQWNDWAFGSQAIVIGEVRVAGHNRHDIMNRLKDLVTDDRIAVTQRNRSVRTVQNRTNYIMFTNHHDALALMSGSRRYFVIKSQLQLESQVLALGSEYFSNLFGMLNDNAAGLRGFFEHWDISEDFNAEGRAPKTVYLEQMIDDSADELTAAIRRVIKEGEHELIKEDLIASATLRTALELQGIRESDNRIAKVLREESFVKLENRPRLGQVREYLWVKHGCFQGCDEKKIIAVAKQRYQKIEHEDQEI